MKDIVKCKRFQLEIFKRRIIFLIRCSLFNIFQSRYFEEIIPEFEIIPRLSIGIRKNIILNGKLDGIYLSIGWLNFYIKFFIDIERSPFNY